MIKIIDSFPSLLCLQSEESIDFNSKNVCYLCKANSENFIYEKNKIKLLFPNSEWERFERRFEIAKESILSRFLLFDFLSKHGNINTKLLKIKYTESGKPYVQNENIYFSLAHSGKTLMVAISFNGQVGIDFEHIEKSKDYSKIAKRFFHPAEYEFLELNKEKNTADIFTKMWIKKEAIVKCLGSTMFTMMNKINTLDNSIYSVDNKDFKSIYISVLKIHNQVCLASNVDFSKVFLIDYDKKH